MTTAGAPSALSQLSPQDRATIAAMGRDTLEERFAHAHLAAIGAAHDAQVYMSALALCVAKYARGLAGSDGKLLSLSAVLPTMAESGLPERVTVRLDVDQETQRITVRVEGVAVAGSSSAGVVGADGNPV